MSPPVAPTIKLEPMDAAEVSNYPALSAPPATPINPMFPEQTGTTIILY